MEATVLRIIKLELTEKEAEWLRGYVQNSPFEDENKYDQEMREDLFDSLEDVLR